MKDLFSPEYFAQKQRERIAKLKPQDFEPWGEARERFISEKSEPMLQTYRLFDHDWFADWSRRRGEVVHSSDLIFRLQKLNPHIFVQQSYNFKNDWGLYSSAMGRVQFLTGVPKGWLTEWSYSIINDRNLPTEERRGWRTILVYALCKGALEWDAVIHEFGESQDSWNDYRWQVITADFRCGSDLMVFRNVSNALE